MKRISLGMATVAALTMSGEALAQGNTATTSASASLTVVQQITLTKDQDLRFGSITKPATAATSNTIKIDSAASCARSVVGGGTGNAQLISSTSGCAAFTVGGEPNLAFNITLPAAGTVNMSNGTTNLPLTFNASPSGSGTLSGAGAATLNVGGEFPVTDTATTGDYTASFNVTVAYQ